MPLPSPFRLERYFAEHEFKVRHLLSASDCESLRLEELLGLADAPALELWRSLGLGYTDSAGHPLLRTEVANLYQAIAPDDVLAVIPEEGIFLAVHAAAVPGDHVIALVPAYHSLVEVARANGCEVTPWRLRLGPSGWHLDLEELKLQGGSGQAWVPRSPGGVRRLPALKSAEQPDTALAEVSFGCRSARMGL